jgi:hypothetical protein
VWKQYEFYVIEQHIAKYGHTVWHTDVIPEKELFNSGFIHDFNSHRLKRIANKRDNNQVKYSDYGMDFLCKYNTNGITLYGAGQAKHYTTRKVTASDIGTFLIVALTRIQGISYLYTLGNLEINLQEDIMNMRGKIIHHQLPYISNTTDIYTATSEAATKYILRPYQQEAIDSIINDGVDILNIFCGGGKTDIARHVLVNQRQFYKLIICIAPLRISVEELRLRIRPSFA